MNKKPHPYNVVREFEECVADYAGSKYAVAVDSCTNAIFLSCKIVHVNTVIIPSRTYFSVPAAILHAGGTVEFEDTDWSGEYFLKPYPIIDSAVRFKRGMHINGTLRCLSFNLDKHLKIGKGGMILTDSLEYYQWFKSARFLGRHENPCHNDNCLCDCKTIDMVGWNMYMTPEQASRGLALMQKISNENEDLMLEYADLSKYDIYKRENYDKANSPST